MSNLVTIGIVTYNQKDFIYKAVQSILEQNYDNIQIIIADDGSQDGTTQIIKKLQSQNPDTIDLILHKNNQGVGANIDSLYSKIKGDYVCFIGGDDYFLPNKINEQVNFFQENESYIASYHNVNVQDQKPYLYNSPFLGNEHYSGNITEKLIENRCFISSVSFMVRKEALTKIRHKAKFGPCNDWLFFIEISMLGKIKYHKEVLATYRRHDNNITKNKFSSEQEEKIYEYLKSHYNDKYYNSIIIGRTKTLFVHAMKYLLARNNTEAKAKILTAVRILRNNPVLIYNLVLFIPYFLLKRVIFSLYMGNINR
jgi:glycosyltransferase involved in cell wall biosynthesis